MNLINREKVIELRTKKGWNQKELAEAAQVNAGVISRLERGLQRDFKVSIMVRIASALDVPVDALIQVMDQRFEMFLVPELQNTLRQLAKEPEHVQRQAEGMLSGFLAALDKKSDNRA